jgi:outer membrane protein
MSKMVEAGTKAQGDLLNIQAQAATEEFQIVQAKNNLDLGYLSLYQLMDITNEDRFIIEAPKLTMLNQTSLQSTPNSIYETALALQPSIKSADLRVKSAELTLKRSYASLMPSISLSGSLNAGFSTKLQTIDQIIPTEVAFGYTKPGNVPVYTMSNNYTYKDYKWNDQINSNLQKSFGVYMSIPIFSNYQGQINVKRSKLNIESSKYDLQLAKQQLNKTIEQAYADSKAALNKYQSAEKTVSSTKESFHYSEQRFNVGLLSSVDYNTAKKELSLAESTLLQAKFDYLFRTTILDFYMGKPISLKIQ